MKKCWLEFLQLRSTIRGQVISLAGGLPRKYDGIQFINLHGNIVERGEAAADYLRYLPPALVPGEATAFLEKGETAACLSEFDALAQRVAAYCPSYFVELADTAGELIKETDAKSALDRYRNLSSRFGDFTVEHRVRMTGKMRIEFVDYNLGADILHRVSELPKLSRHVGPFERALAVQWYQRAVPATLQLPIDGNVFNFLHDAPGCVNDAEAYQATMSSVD